MRPSRLAAAVSFLGSRFSVAAVLLLLLPGSGRGGTGAAPVAGSIPNILVWQHDEVAPGSGADLLADLSALGEDAALTSDLFAYSPDLSAHEAVFAIVGIYPDKHILDAAEGAALDGYVQNGGRLYLEGGDCFNEDPETSGAYNVRPVFGLDDGPGGSGGFSGDIVGINLLEAFRFDFDYAGTVFELDELNPVASMPILLRENGGDVLGVWKQSYGAGSAIGASFEYSGLLDLPGIARSGTTPRQDLLAAYLNLLRGLLPAVDVPQSAFAFQVPVLGTSEDGLTIRNDGSGPLEYDLAVEYLGDVHRDEFASTANSVSDDYVFRGNVYQAENSVPLLEIEHYLDLVWATQVEFFVYENASATGTFSKVFSKTVVAGANEAFQSSGPIHVPLSAGTFYLIGCSWRDQGEVFDDAGSTGLPAPVSFGSVLSSTAGAGHPAPGTTVVSGAGSVVYAQAVETGVPATLSFLAPTHGSVPAGEETNLGLRAAGGTIPGVYDAELTVTHNAPGAGPVVIPVEITVFDPTAAEMPTASPAAFALHAARPNPTRDETRIGYELPRATRVRLSVFDVTGRRVRTLVDGLEAGGRRTVSWDGRDGAGRAVPSGVYFYRLQAGAEVLGRSIALLR
jgi:hypothetical protein